MDQAGSLHSAPVPLWASLAYWFRLFSWCFVVVVVVFCLFLFFIVVMICLCHFWMVDLGGLETGSDVAKNDPALSCVPLSSARIPGGCHHPVLCSAGDGTQRLCHTRLS